MPSKAQLLRLFLGGFCVLGLLACGSTKKEPKPLVKLDKLSQIGEAWRNNSFSNPEIPHTLAVADQTLALAASVNSVAVLNTLTGKVLHTVSTGAGQTNRLASAVGYSGELIAVTTLGNQLVLFKSANFLPATAKGAASSSDPRELWRINLPSRAYTPPLIAGGRVFVLLGDKTVQAYDADNGNRIWSLPRNADSLTLSQSGSLGVYKNTLLAGGSGRLAGINPDNGQLAWELPVAITRATNDVEKLIDLIGAPNRSGDSVCVRAYQAGIACLDLLRGQPQWSVRSLGAAALGGDAQVVASVEFDGKVKLHERKTGAVRWTNEQLMFRGLSAPLVIGNSVVIADAQGYVHVLDKEDGALNARFSTDGSAITTPPVVAGNTVMVVTAKGNVYAYSPK